MKTIREILGDVDSLMTYVMATVCISAGLLGAVALVILNVKY